MSACLEELTASPKPRGVLLRAMAIKKQEFYEGAALHLLARSGRITSIRYDTPFFLLNNRVLVLLKYSTRGRSPWGFTFTTDEQTLLKKKAAEQKVVIGLVCGADGVATFNYDGYRRLAALRNTSAHIACYRKHGEHYEVSGPDGTLDGKVAPSNWQKILENRGDDDAS